MAAMVLSLTMYGQISSINGTVRNEKGDSLLNAIIREEGAPYNAVA